MAELDTHNRLGKADGRFPHWVTPYEGNRYSLIYVSALQFFIVIVFRHNQIHTDSYIANQTKLQYVTSGAVEPQTTAIFPPRHIESEQTQEVEDWIPPPIFVP